MSAIAGIVHFNGEPVHNESIELMNMFKQYPTDSVQTWVKDSSFLGCHAQWITPESRNELNPYHDYERCLVITADAIIDNRKELSALLGISSDKLRTISDTQLILLSYSKWGENVPKYLIGDFAFMLWDIKNSKLFGARDFSGSRTLYYYNDQSRFAFSTTINPLFSLPYIKKNLNEDWLAEFIAIPTMVESVDVSSTVYKGINQLPPAHSISIIDGNVKVSKYMTIVPEKKLKLKSDAEYEDAFQSVFGRAVTDRIRTFGEVGSHLSGGLDSGTVVSFAAKDLKKHNKRLHTYSYVPEDDFIDWTPNYYTADETPFIRETVEYVGNITANYLDFKGESPLSEVDEFLDIMEMPYKFFENTFWLKGIYEKAQAKNIKIMLNGARGNHSISWGSWNLTMNYYTNLLKNFRWIRLYHELGEYCKNYNTGKSVMVPLVAKKAFPTIMNRFNSVKVDYQFPVMINDSLANRTKVFEKLRDYGMDISGGNIAINRLNEYRKAHYEQPYYWNKNGTATTKLSLRYGMWDRDPTNDLRVIQFCLAIPEEQYVKGGIERAFIRRATEGLLPDKVRLNHKTRGIQGADVIHRMKNRWEIFLEELESMTTDPEMSELLNMDVIKKAVLEVKGEPQLEFVTSDDFKILTRSLIIYKFVKERG